MAIISVNENENTVPVYRRYWGTQARYAMTYVLITLCALLLLNIYSTRVSQRLFHQAKKTAMIEKCLIAASDIRELEVISTTTVTDAVAQLASLKVISTTTDGMAPLDSTKVSRLIVTDQAGVIIYDSYGPNAGRYAMLPEVVQALSTDAHARFGNEVFTWRYHDGTMQSHAAVPVVAYGTIVGCVYMMETDTALGGLIQSLQRTLLQITLILEVTLILFSLAFSNTFSRRIRQIMASMRIIQQGDYTHKVSLSGHDELTFLGDEFNDLTERLQTSEQKRRRFVSDASHELKTPLASIKLLTDSILQNDMDMDTVREFVSDIGNEADRLNRTTGKLLSLTRVDGQLTEECEIIYMSPTIERVVRMLSVIAAENGITIETDLLEDSPVLFEDDLYQVAFNLVENGIKYNTPGGKLTVTLRRNEDTAELIVADTGVGIPADMLSHIFERFYRVDKARSRATGGSGLGLAIVRAIIQRNRGEISVTSEVGRGTTFTVSFPVFDTEVDAT